MFTLTFIIITIPKRDKTNSILSHTKVVILNINNTNIKVNTNHFAKFDHICLR